MVFLGLNGSKMTDCTPRQTITSEELNTAISELLTFYNRNTDNKSYLTPDQKNVEKMMNYTFVSMVNDAIHSYLVRIY